MSRVLELVKKLLNKPIYLISILLILSLVALWVVYSQYQKTQNDLAKIKNDSQAVRVEETKKLLEQVSRVMVLPSSEIPTVATITDISKLKNQPFFAKAQNGDKLLIYTDAKRAILFRPSTNKVIDVAPVNIGTVTPSISPTVTPTSTP